MLTNLCTSNIEQQLASTSQETIFSSSSCHETVVTPNTLIEMSPNIVTSHTSDLNFLRNSGSPRHFISVGDVEQASQKIQHRVKHMVCSCEFSFGEGCDFHHKNTSNPTTSKTLCRNFRNMTSLADATVRYSLNEEDSCEVTSTCERNASHLAANAPKNTCELAVFSNFKQHITSSKCVRESAFQISPDNQATRYNSNNSGRGKSSIPAPSDTDNIHSRAASVTCSKKLWNFGCSRKKSDIICDTVDAWSSSCSGKLFLNLKQSLFGHMNRTESMLLVGGSKPLVFGGTYPIDMPLEGNVKKTVGEIDEEVSLQTYDIDAPYLGFLEQTLASASVDSWNTVVRRNKIVSQQCTVLGSSAELKHSSSTD